MDNAKAGAKAAAPISVTDAATARADIQQTLGLVPGFFNSFPDEGLAGAWREMKGLQLNPNTAIPNKYKELIGLAVASQIPCRYCIAFHTNKRSVATASREQVRKPIYASSIGRWKRYESLIPELMELAEGEG